jgi:hypothetical protein
VLGAQARDYRDTLVLAARRLLDATTPAGARAFAAGSIVARIESLDRGCRSSTGLARGVSAATAIAIAACVLPMAPRAADLREQARAVFAAEQRGEIQSCFALQAAAMVLAEPSDASTPTQR